MQKEATGETTEYSNSASVTSMSSRGAQQLRLAANSSGMMLCKPVASEVGDFGIF